MIHASWFEHYKYRYHDNRIGIIVILNWQQKFQSELLRMPGINCRYPVACQNPFELTAYPPNKYDVLSEAQHSWLLGEGRYFLLTRLELATWSKSTTIGRNQSRKMGVIYCDSLYTFPHREGSSYVHHHIPSCDGRAASAYTALSTKKRIKTMRQRLWNVSVMG